LRDGADAAQNKPQGEAMSISLAIAVVVLADIALLAGLAYVMSQPRKLARHILLGNAGQDRVSGQDSVLTSSTPVAPRIREARPQTVTA
jgi:hypothetical protein